MALSEVDMNIRNTGQMDLYGQVRLERPETPRVGGRSPSAKGASALRTDTVSVSDEAVLRTEAYRTAMNAPDVRQDRINQLRDQIANGTYSIDSRRIADRLLREEADMYS